MNQELDFSSRKTDILSVKQPRSDELMLKDSAVIPVVSSRGGSSSVKVNYLAKKKKDFNIIINIIKSNMLTSDN